MLELDPTRRHVLSLLAGYGLVAVATARAETGALPSALKVVLPLPPGGSADAAVRLLGDLLHKRHGTTVTLENRPGASGLLGLKTASTAAADGSTLAYIISSHVTTDLLSPQLDLLKEFDAVTMDSSAVYLVLVNADSPYRSLAGLVAAAKQSPGKLTYGSGGPGSALHIGMATLADAAGMQMLHLPYKGGIAAAQALAAGEVDVALALPGSARALLAGGRVRALAVMAPDRLALMPEVPTMREATGVSAVYGSWSGYVVPKGYTASDGRRAAYRADTAFY